MCPTMTQSPVYTWSDLFAAESGEPTALVQALVVRKRGRPLLALPADKAAATAALDLYPAQTARARAARAMLRLLLKAGAPVLRHKVSFSVAPQEEFAKFLATQAGIPPGEVPLFAVLAGNPAAKGQRFMVLLFNPDKKPVAVVKTGLSEEARALVQYEATFLEAAGGRAPGIPKLRGSFENSRLDSLALDFAAGHSPRPAQVNTLPGLLASWVDFTRSVRLPETRHWLRLEQSASANAVFPALKERLHRVVIKPVIHHGDFAPWNIKVSADGNWTVLDWERGELTGIPGWDWFHYLVQNQILVHRRSTGRVLAQVQSLLGSENFKQYARLAGISRREPELLLAYLLYIVEVIKPSEGMAENRALLQALAREVLPG